MKLALEALEKSEPVNQGVGYVKHHNNAKRALRAAIAEAEKSEDARLEQIMLGVWQDVGDPRFPSITPKPEPVDWRDAALRVGEDLCSVGPFGYYDMTAEQWLEWALSVVTMHHPPRPDPMLEAEEPALWGMPDGKVVDKWGLQFYSNVDPKDTTPYYTHPPRREAAPQQEACYKVTVVDDQNPTGITLQEWGQKAPRSEPTSWHHPACEGECIACLIERVVKENYGTQGLGYLRRHLDLGGQVGAIAEAEKQEPVANDRTMTVVYRNVTPDDARSLMSHPMAVWFGWCHAPYERDHARSLLDMAAAPSREWVGLTDEEIAKLHYATKAQFMGTFKIEDIYHAIETKLKEKNS